MPRFQRHQWLWIILFFIIVLFIFAPHAGITELIRQMFHALFGMLQQMIDRAGT